MGRFLLVWMCLAIPLVVTTLTISTLGFRHLDVRYVTFVQLLVIPVFQAVVVTWVSGQWGLSRWVSAAREAMSHRWIALFVVLDVAFLSLGVAAHGYPIVGIAGEGGLHPKWAAVKALIAGAVLLGSAFRAEDSHKSRPWVVGLAGMVLAVSSAGFFPWLTHLPNLIPGRGHMIIKWLIVYGGLSTLGLFALCRVSAKACTHSPLAAFFFDLAGACLFAVALVCALNIFLRPFLVEPWLSIAWGFVSIGTTALLVGSSLLFVHRDHDRRYRGSSTGRPM